MTDSRELQRTKHCKQCGAVLDRAKLGSNYYGQKFCSQACMAESYRGGPEQFWAKVDKNTHPGGCWLYMGFRKWDGYGWLRRVIDGKGRYMTAHRYAWYLKHGMPAKGIHILHTCDNPPCCNPAHLRLGTHQANMADCVQKLRHSYGEKGKNKLTRAQVAEIRPLKGKVSSYALAEKYGVSYGAIAAIWRGKTWKIDQPAQKLPERVRPRRQA